MKKILVAKTRWEYYVANVAGILSLTGLFAWFLTLSISNDGVDLGSVFFWMAAVLLIIIPYSLIGFFSSMKTVEVTNNELSISYVFQKHTNLIRFADIAIMKSSKTKKETIIRQRTVRESFKIILTDGRVFEFERSQFQQYDQLKTICLKQVKRKSH